MDSTPAPTTDGLVAAAWQILNAQMGAQKAQQFFERHVVDGAELLGKLQEDGNQQPRAGPSTLEKMRLQRPATVIGRSTNSETPRPAVGAHPTTQVDIARHLKILDRKWLVTGYIVRVFVPGQPTRRVPLNYRTVEIGNQGGQYDIEIPLPPGQTYHVQLRFRETGFNLSHQGGTVSTQVNGQPVTDEQPLSDGDIIVAGGATIRIFRLLDPPAELTVVSGQGAGERFVIDTSEVHMGRFGKRDNDIILQDPTVSREHASIRYRDGKFWLVPETTSSPTVVNGEPVPQARALVDNDQVLLGEQTLVFRVRGTSNRPRTLHSRTATVVFSDLRGWTPLAESMPLQDLINQMDEYFKAMGEIITTLGGTLMTYQGDAIMAIFGAPSSHKDDPWRAVASSVQMQSRLRVLNVKWEKEGRAPLSCGIGIHTGVVMVGELGHSSRLEYSAMGDTTNLAARLEQLTRDYNCDIIMSEATYKEVADEVETESLGEVTVKGKSVPTRIYRVLELKEGHLV